MRRDTSTFKVEEGTGELATWAKNSKWKILRLGQTGFLLAALLTYYGDLNQSNLLPSLSLSYRFGRFSEAKLNSAKNVDLLAKIGPMCGLS